MTYQEKLIRQLAKKYNIDYRVVKEIVYSPLKFTNRVVTDNTDMRPIRIMYFGVFTQKDRKNKANRMSGIIEVLLDNLDEVKIVMEVTSAESAKKIIENARKTNDYKTVKTIWDAWQEYIK